MKPATHERKGATITNLKTGKHEWHKTVNKAKKASRVIQLRNGGLGCGAVQVIQ